MYVLLYTWTNVKRDGQILDHELGFWYKKKGTWLDTKNEVFSDHIFGQIFRKV